MTNPPPPPSDGGYPPPPDGSYPPPPQGGYPQQGGYQPPPSQGGYPPPPQGGYPPPPQGGYGGPPQGGYPPPPQGGYPPPPQFPPGGYQPFGNPNYAGPQPFDLSTAFSWAWNKFSKNAAALIVPTLVYALVLGILGTVVGLLVVATSPDSVSSYDSYDAGFSYSMSSGLGFGSLVVAFLGGVLIFVVLGAISSAYYAGMLDIANGQPVTIGSFFKPRNVGNVLIASLLIGIVSSILSFCFIFSLVISLLTLFTTVMIVDRNVSAIAAIKGSFELVKSNFGQAILVWLIALVIIFVGALVCGVGLLVAAPVAGLFLVYAYRQLSGGQVAPLTP